MTEIEKTINIRRKLIADYLFGSSSDLTIGQRILMRTAFFGAIVGILSSFINWFLNLGQVLVIVSICSFFMFGAFFYLSRFKSAHKYLIVPFILLTMSFMTITWFLNGGYDSANGYLFFNLMMICMIIVNESSRKYLLAFCIFVMCGIITINYYYPGLVKPYRSQGDRFQDIIATVFYSIIILYYLVQYVLKNYQEERLKVEEKKKQIEQQNVELIHKKTELEELNDKLETQNSLISDQNIELEALNEDLTCINRQVLIQKEELEKLNANFMIPMPPKTSSFQ